MNSKTIKILSVGFLISILFAVTAFPTANTQPTGIDAGIADIVETNGCNCHDANPNSGVEITLSGLPDGNFNVSEEYTLTLNISGGPAPIEDGNQGGFFISVSQGTLTAIDDNVWKPEGKTHLTHTEDGNDFRTWTFKWTAPESDSVVAEFNVYGNSVNGNADGAAGGSNW